MIKELKELIEREKYVIVDLHLKKTVRAVKDSCKIGPKGEPVSYKLERHFNSPFDFSVEFKPNQTGRYRVDVENVGIPINNSPFFVNVFDPSAALIKSRPNSFIVGYDNIIERILFILIQNFCFLLIYILLNLSS